MWAYSGTPYYVIRGGFLLCTWKANLLSSSGLCNGHANSEDSIGTELRLVGATWSPVSPFTFTKSISPCHSRSVELVEEVVHRGLVLDVDLLLDEGRSDDIVHIRDGLGDTLATPLGLVSIAQLARLVGTGGGAGGNNSAVEAGLTDEVNFDGGVAARVVDSTGMDLGDGHIDFREE
jgi:hypothetical protein